MKLNQSHGLATLMLLQAACAAFFIGDVAYDLTEIGTAHASHGGHLIIEILATFSLTAGIFVAFRMLKGLLQQQEQMAESLKIATGSLSEIMEKQFRTWNFTPAERDIALLTMKGASISDIATYRNSATATIKTHLHAIYRKANVSGRTQLISLFLDDLLVGPLSVRPLAEANDFKTAAS